ncbi:unnamed protein product [Phytophthora lilii]|uniref:RxLR effector protein n=1 Tax=Phytophthora lilii TaxID=2077276 RepID=A0A9W6THA0_9STRA|nr:unnamed protein product [Phytophthora lilii]
MRLSSILVAVAAAALLPSSIALSAVSSAGEATDSTIALLILVGGDQNADSTKRRLRAHKSAGDKYEERYKLKKINKLMNQQFFREDIFNKWIKHKYADSHIYNKFDVVNNPIYSRIVNQYQDYLMSLRKHNLLTLTSFDFLVQNPPPPPGWKVFNVPLWWRKVLQDWNRIKWPQHDHIPLTSRQTLHYVLFSPIWWNTSTKLHVGTSSRSGQSSKPMGSGNVRFRRMCRALAEQNKLCLADFLDVSRNWPSPSNFLQPYALCSME